MRTGRALIAATIALCAAGTIASCGPATSGEQPAPTPPVSFTSPPASPNTQSPETRIEGHFAAFDASAAKGWPDTSYNTQYLAPELASKADGVDQANAATGETIVGERQLSEWTALEESDTQAVVEFCNGTANRKNMKDGKQVVVEDAPTESVGRFTLSMPGADQPYLISEMGYYPKGTTCVEHFAQYDR